MSIARRALALAICFLIVVRRGEPSLLTSSRAILLDVLIVVIGMVNGCLLQHLTNSIATRFRLAMALFASDKKNI